MQGIFEGVRVLDFTNVLSGPSVTRLLAEQGAEIIKSELPPFGDISRSLPAMRNGRSGYFVQQNRGKRCICVDVKDPRGREVVRELVAEVDVLVQNFSDAMSHPHMQETGIVRWVTDDRIGDFQIPGVPIRFSEFPDDLVLESSDLGEDNRAVLTELAGLSAPRYEELVLAGVLISYVPG